MRLKIILGVLGVSLLAAGTSASAGAFGYRGGGFHGGGAYIGGGGPGVVVGTRGIRGGADPYYGEDYGDEYSYNDPAYMDGDGVVSGRSAAEDFDLSGPFD